MCVDGLFLAMLHTKPTHVAPDTVISAEPNSRLIEKYLSQYLNPKCYALRECEPLNCRKIMHV